MQIVSLDSLEILTKTFRDFITKKSPNDRMSAYATNKEFEISMRVIYLENKHAINSDGNWSYISD